ncbi:uncharacterized protein [Euwallacea fornicatus]|uniref:uncharacterized protein n=1 Tax=Euwallacea fornicatus TaxID=995702 RepID=UPI00338F1713
MKIFCPILFVLSSLWAVSCEQRLLIDQLRREFLELEDKLWNLPSNWLLNRTQEDAEMYLAKKFFRFSQELLKMPQDLLYGVSPLRTVPDFLFLYSDLKSIDLKYEKFSEFLKFQLQGSQNKMAIEDIIYDVLNNTSSAENIMKRVYEMAYDHQGSMKQEIHRLTTENFWCKDLAQSPQQLFYNLYNRIALTDLKAYVMQQFAYLGNLIWEKGANDDLSIGVRKRYEQRTTHVINGLALAMKQPQDIWKCDPETFILGKTYDAFTRLLQGVIQNEVDINSYRTCKRTCNDYHFTKSYGCYDYESDFCSKLEGCSGNVINCFFVESYGTICASAAKSYRRYEYVKYTSGKTMGKSDSCPNHRTVNSWTRWFVRCHYCMCLCDQVGPFSDRYINLRPVMADVKNNRVVTGLRFVKHNRILHLQIQEGELLPYGYINQRTVQWVKLDSYQITDRGVQNKIDFFAMSHRERSMAMDEIQVNEDNHVLTGVRFQFRNGEIYLQIHVSSFDWHTGKVNDKEGHYIYETSREERVKYQLSKPDIPTKTPSRSRMHFSASKRYVEFTHTDFEKDVAQTTVPFIDIQEVVNRPAVPLIGAGIYYKGNDGYGGFIAPRIKTYNFAKHVSSKMPQMTHGVMPYIEDNVEIN